MVNRFLSATKKKKKMLRPMKKRRGAYHTKKHVNCF